MGAFFPSRGRRERGFALSLELMAAVVVTGLVATGIGSAVAYESNTVRNYIGTQVAWGSATTLEDRLRSEARGANAIATPPNDGAGAANCTGGYCHELLLFAKDAQRNGHFWGYRFTNNVIQRYIYIGVDSLGNPKGGSADGTPVAATNFQAKIVTADRFASDGDISPLTKQIIAAKGLTPHSTLFNYGLRGINGGNYVAIVKITNAEVVDSLSLATRVLPSTELLSAGTYAPTPPPGMQYAGGNGGTLIFNYPTAGAQNFQFHESYYHDAFTLNSAPCGGVASGNPNSALPNPNPLSPPGQDSGPATFTASPVGQGVCSDTVTDSYGQTINENVVVMGPLQSTPTSMTFTTPSDPAQGASFSKTFDNQQVVMSFSGCAGIAAVSGPTYSVPGGYSATPSTTSVTISPIAYGSCTITGTDQYGETGSIAVTVYAAPVYNLTASSANPNPVNVGSSSLINANTSLVNPGQVAPGTPTSVPINVAVTGPCSYQGVSSSTYSFLANAPGTCNATFTANANNSPRTVPFFIQAPVPTAAQLQAECTSLWTSYWAGLGKGPVGTNYGVFTHPSNGAPNPDGVAYFIGEGNVLSSEVIVNGGGFFSAHRNDYFVLQTQHFVYAKNSLTGPQQTASFLYAESTNELLVAPWSPTNNAPNDSFEACIIKDTVPGYN